jgi:hypothetical protein
MTSTPLTPALGRIILCQLEEPKRESAIVLDGFKPWDAWDRQRLTGFLEELASRGFVARDPAPEKVRTPGPWRVTEQGREAMTRGDFLGD